MCTAVSFNIENSLFGRNLDVECEYGERVIITPRNFTLKFKNCIDLSNHYAIIGVGIREGEYPLYFDAANEHGLAMAGLNFVGNAKYFPPIPHKTNVAPYEFIPYVLGKFKSIKEAMAELGGINLTNLPFNSTTPLAELHWIIADRYEAITVEQTDEGLRIYENKVGILTNNPPFPFHMQNLAGHLNLTSNEAHNRFSETLDLEPYSRGMGAIGLPGDPSSASRFVRAAFIAQNSTKSESCIGNVCQLFHILSSVEQVQGSAAVGDKFERTEYSSVIDLDSLTYYYRTYTNSQICAVRLPKNDDTSYLKVLPMHKAQSIEYQN